MNCNGISWIFLLHLHKLSTELGLAPTLTLFYIAMKTWFCQQAWASQNDMEPIKLIHLIAVTEQVCVSLWGGGIVFCTGVYLCKLPRVAKNKLGSHMNFLNKIKIGYWPIFYKVVGRWEEGMFVIRPCLIKKKPKYFLILSTRSWSEYIDCNIESHVVI